MEFFKVYTYKIIDPAGQVDIDTDYIKGIARAYFFTEALAEFQHVNCMIVWIWDVKRAACYIRTELLLRQLPQLPLW